MYNAEVRGCAMNDLHSKIMNLQVMPYDGTDAYTHYCRGHRDARHAAAELVSEHGVKFEQQLEELQRQNAILMSALKIISESDKCPAIFAQIAIDAIKKVE